MQTFRLLLSPADNGIKVIVVDSEVGQGQIMSKLPFDGRADRSKTILKALEASTFQSRDFQEVDEQDWMVQVGLLNESKTKFHPSMRETIGRILYQSLFPTGSKVEILLHRAIEHAESSDQLLHLELNAEADMLNAEADIGRHVRVFDYPWEMLHDGTDFLVTRRVSLSRYIAYESASPRWSKIRHVNVLLVSAYTFDVDNDLQLIPEKEHQIVRESLDKAEKEKHIHLEILEHATFRALGNYLASHRGDRSPNVIHFNGHGLFGRQCSNPSCRKVDITSLGSVCSHCGHFLSKFQGFLLFEGDTFPTHPEYLSAERFAAELGIANIQDGEAHIQNGVTLVMLSACKSGVSRVADSVFNGVAQSLIRARVPALVAMQFSVSFGGAAAFAERFYRSLGEQDALVTALIKGRVAMDIWGDQWYRPVLYLRWQDNKGGQIFVGQMGEKRQPASPLVPAVAQATAPAPPAHFVGRKTEIINLTKALTNESHPHAIVTLQGMGGIGKTALVQQLAVELRDAFPGGIFWADLRSKNVDPMPILSTWVQLCGGDLTPQVSVEKTRGVLAGHVYQHGRVLIILDDVRTEWLSGVQTLLAARPAGIPVPVLFRHASNPLDSFVLVQGQHFQAELPLFDTCLTTRDGELATTLGAYVHRLDILPEQQALELLATIVGEKLVAREELAAKRLAEAVGYLPLALELAGKLVLLRSQKKSWRLEDLCIELEHTGANNALQLTGQTGLDATFSLSYNALDRKLQKVFRILGIFAAIPVGASHIASVLGQLSSMPLKRSLQKLLSPFNNYTSLPRIFEMIPFNHSVDEDQLESELDELVQRSLLRWDEREEAETRYNLHPLLRDYAIRLLEQEGEVAAAGTAHTEHYLAYAHSYRHSSDTGYAPLEMERINILLAMDRAYQAQHWDQVRRFMKALDKHLDTYGYWHEQRIRLEQAIDAAKMLGNQNDAAVFSGNLAILAMNAGDTARARQEFKNRLSFFQQTHSWADASVAAHYLGLMDQTRGDYEDAERRYKQSLDFAKKAGLESRVIIETKNLAQLAQLRGRDEEAEELYHKCLNIARQGENYKEIADALANLALFAQGQGKDADAERFYQQGLEYLEQVDDEEDVSDILNSLAAFLENEKKYIEAEQLYQRSKSISEKLKNKRGFVHAIIRLGFLSQRKGEMSQARMFHEQGLSLHQELNDQSGIARDLYQLGTLAQVRGEYSEAERLYQRSLDIFRKLEDQGNIASTTSQLGYLAQIRGEYSEAERLYQQSLDISRKLEDQGNIASTTSQLGTLAEARGEYSEAERLYQQSLDISRKLEDKGNIASTTSRLGTLAQIKGEYSEAGRLYQQSLDIFRKLEDKGNIANTTSQLGYLAEARG
ncbi:MAG TPA: tetratricopeptide repeat protein, partial [Ktedonobacteraceae bacterium]|nr:tetratricopeptide repeat protein [Ktedonobacteraceae bacterium]